MKDFTGAQSQQADFFVKGSFQEVLRGRG
jgi:hypothetical protein